MILDQLAEHSLIALFYIDSDMSKKVLILTLSSDVPPYDKMVKTALETWDSVGVENCETYYYFSNRNKKSEGKFLYFPFDESLHTMGYKLLAAFEWALANKEFDYIFRPHSCIYVNKKELVKYVQDLPQIDLFASLPVVTGDPWMWFGCGAIFSRDVVQKIVDNNNKWNHKEMEDKACSQLAYSLGVPFTPMRACSIDKIAGGWRCTAYNSQGFDFLDFSEIIKSEGQFFYRVKQDGQRDVDDYIMRQLFKYLK